MERPVAYAALAYVAIASVLAIHLGTWTDEEYTLATTAHGPVYAFGRAISYELQAPLYFVLEAMWRELDPASVWWARLPSILCNGALFLTFARIARRIAPERNPLPLVLLASLNPYVVFAGLEIRLYAPALLISTLAWLFFDAGFASGSSARARVAFVLTATCALYLQYLLGFFLIGFAFTLLVRGRVRPIVAYVIACVPIALAAIVPASWAVHQVGGIEPVTGALATPQWILSQLGFPLKFVFPWSIDWPKDSGASLAYEIAVSFAVALAIAARPRLTRDDLGWIAGALAVHATFLVLVFGFKVGLAARHYASLYTPVAVATYAIAAGMWRGSRPRFVALFGLSVVLTIASLFTSLRALAQPGDWSRVGAYLTQVVRPNDVIVVYSADSIPALVRQYAPNVPVVPFPTTVSPDVFSVARLSVSSTAQARSRLESLRAYRRIWFVSDVKCAPPETPNGCDYVGPAIDGAFRIDSERAFYGSTVEELVAKR